MLCTYSSRENGEIHDFCLMILSAIWQKLNWQNYALNNIEFHFVSIIGVTYAKVEWFKLIGISDDKWLDDSDACSFRDRSNIL